MMAATNTDTALEPQDREFFASNMEGRAATYALLSTLYRQEVTAEQLDELHAMRFPVHSGNEDMDAGYYQVAKYLSNIWENTLTELAVDYVRCFVGHGNNSYAAAYPYESVYTSSKRLLMQSARDEVRAIYRAAGLDRDESWNEGEDHISLELDYLRILCERAAAAFRAGDKDRALGLLRAQMNFLEDHLLFWTHYFFADVERLAATGFYQGLNKVARGFLHLDHQFLKEALADE